MPNSHLNSDQAHGLRKITSKHSTKVIAISAGKGGVGKTNISVNLAIALAKKKKEVLLFDGDLSLANIDVMLGLNPKYNLSHVLDNRCQLSDIVIKGPSGLNILPASSGIEAMSRLDNKAYLGIIDGFNTLASSMDYLLVDTAAGVSDDVLSFTRSSDDMRSSTYA